MSYQTEFSSSFDLGFKVDDFPVKITDKSYHNDICPSFYFNKNNNYFILWVNYKEKKLREDPDSNRYILTHGVNEGDENHHEIYVDHNKLDICSTEDINEIKKYILGII